MSEIELKACPFCGGRDIRDFGGLAWSMIPECRGCGARAMGPFSEGKRNPVDVWNTRAAHWKPIESAPKDGTAILLTNGKDVAEGHWYFEEGGTTEHRDLDGRYIDQTESDGYDGWLDWDGGMQPDPTHWMPLPAPPEVEG